MPPTPFRHITVGLIPTCCIAGFVMLLHEGTTIDFINLLEVQYSISINWLLILILILRLQIHEIVKIRNSVMNLQDILLQEI